MHAQYKYNNACAYSLNRQNYFVPDIMINELYINQFKFHCNLLNILIHSTSVAIKDIYTVCNTDSLKGECHFVLRQERYLTHIWNGNN